jgi:hypothetical protein
MQNTQTSAPYSNTPPVAAASTGSAVSWGAVIAGAVIAAAVSAMLITGGTGLGFLSLSPWRHEDVSGPALAVGAIIWLLATQIIAYGVAGYVAGRLRTRWVDAARDEIYFRDTAHGFLVWALSAVVGLALLGSTVASVVSGAAKTGMQAGASAAAAPAGQPAQAGARLSGLDYYADAQQRLKQNSNQAGQTAQQAGQEARGAADDARKTAATFSLWAFASLLIGAFVASLAATMGGRTRDR